MPAFFSSLLALFLSMSVLFASHMLGGVVVLGAVLFLIARACRNRAWNALAWFIFICLAALAANASWILGVLRFLHYEARADGFFGEGFVDFTESEFANISINWVMIVAGLTFLLFQVRDDERAERRTATAVLVGWNLLIACFGSTLPFFEHTEPNRFLVGAAAAGTCGLAFMPRPSTTTARGRSTSFALWAPLAVLALLCFVRPALGVLNPDADGFVLKSAKVGQWIKDHSAPGARVFFEDRSPFDISPAGVQLYAEREFIGGPFSRANLIHRFSNPSTNTGKIFGTSLEALTASDWQSAIRAYNLQAIVVFSGAMMSAVQKHPQLFRRAAELTLNMKEKRAEEPWQPKITFVLYEVIDHEPDRFIVGTGQVVADYNRLAVSHASPGTVVLPYHWMEGLHSTPALPLRARYFWRDPVPFIEVTNGDVSSFAIDYAAPPVPFKPPFTPPESSVQ